MPDIYQSLIGAPPSGPEETAAIAAKLRRQQNLGVLGMLSGNKTLSPVGQAFMGQAEARSVGLQKAREAGLDNTRDQERIDAQASQYDVSNALADETLAEKIRHNKAMEEAAQAKANSVGKKFVKMTDSTRTSLSDASTSINEMGRMRREFDTSPDLISGSGYPLTGTAANFVASNAPAFAGEEMKEKQKWWADWDRIYNLPERNRMFGATLTDNEKRVWAAANINPNMAADQIKDNMRKIHEIYERNLQRKTEAMILEGFDPQVLGIYTGTIGSYKKGGSYPGEVTPSSVGSGDDEIIDLRGRQ